MTANGMLAIRIAAITLASDSAITIARFRPSKVCIFDVSQAIRRITQFESISESQDRITRYSATKIAIPRA